MNTWFHYIQQRRGSDGSAGETFTPFNIEFGNYHFISVLRTELIAASLDLAKRGSDGSAGSGGPGPEWLLRLKTLAIAMSIQQP